MRMKITLKKAIFSAIVMLLPCHAAVASTIINNYGTSNNQPPAAMQPPPPPQQQQCNANNTIGTDPRVPPAGTYNIQHGDGSSEEVYTTGEKKPYYVDNTCNQNAIAPQIYVQPNITNPNVPEVTR